MTQSPSHELPALTDFELDPAVRRGIEHAGFVTCTPIQAAALPLALAGRDVAGQAQTGTGKTAAFLVAMLNRLMTREPSPERQPTQPRALILAPTRELAVQIHGDAEVLNAYTGLTLALAYGGTGYESQRAALARGTDILIGTPGRIIDYFKQKVFDLRATEVMVLDEADRMFDLGFIKDIRYLLRRMPPPDKRLNMLFSATLSYRVTELAYEHMNDPQQIHLDTEQVTAEHVRQKLYHVSTEEKIPLLLGLLKRMEDMRRVLIFINTKRAGDEVLAYLLGNDIKAAVLSGDVPQNKREHLLEDFRRGNLPVLVATDVAARGLHIPDVTHVINFDLPQDAEDYVHRIGRTARLGAEGEAISLSCDRYCYSLPDIEEYIGEKIPAEVAEPSLLATPEPPAQLRRRRGQGRGKGRGGPPGKGRPPGKRRGGRTADKR